MRNPSAQYPLLDALVHRRSRRFCTGMRMDSGPMVYTSKREPLPLCEEEEALLAFAACGVTGYALADLVYSPGGGGTIMAGNLGRTVPSGDAIHTVSVFAINNEATYFLKRPSDFPAGDVSRLAGLAQAGEFVDLYRESRVKIKDGRSEPPLDLFFNLNVNRWSLYDKASTYFLPVNELTLLYINGLLEVFGDENGAFIVDERRGFQPAGLKKFAKSRGGKLNDDPKLERTMTIQQLESLVTEFVTVEQGAVIQNLALMTQSLGLGGFPHWAAHPYGWLQALGFRTKDIPATEYLGMGSFLRFFARLLGKDQPVPHGLGLEHDGEPLLIPYTPPWFPSMEAAVHAVLDLKFGSNGVFRTGEAAWKDAAAVRRAAKPPSDDAVAATIAYCTYVYDRYGRFPAYQPPFRTVLGFQAGHVDPDFYDRFYRPEALSESQHNHMSRWHPDINA